MNALRRSAAELAGLFVEDPTFALAIALCLGACGALAALHAIPPAAGGIALFAALASVLVASVAIAARRSR